jgi:hypothetical protein
MMPDKDRPKEEKKTEVEPVKVIKTSPPWPLITIGVFGSVVLVAVIIGGLMFVRAHHEQELTTRPGMMGQLDQNGGQQLFNRGGTRRGGMMQSAAANGVVTTITGDTITVAGQGKTVTVKKSSTTTIGGDKTDIAVNDSVIVFGTANSDGSVNATRIDVRNEAGTRAMDDSSDNTGAMMPDSSSL